LQNETVLTSGKRAKNARSISLPSLLGCHGKVPRQIGK